MRYRKARLFDLVVFLIPLLFSARLFFMWQGLSITDNKSDTVKTAKKGQKKNTIINPKMIVDKDLFSVKPPPIVKKKNPVRVKKRKKTPPPPPPKKIVASNLRLELHGVIMDDDDSVAFIYNLTNRENNVYSIGEIIQPGVKLTKVLLHKIIIDNNGRRQEIVEKGYKDDLKDLLSGKAVYTGSATRTSVSRPTKNQAFAITKVKDTVYITQKEVGRQVKNLSSLLSQVRVQPYFRGGRAQGFKVLHVKRGSFMEALGIKAGDIIKAINGQLVDSMQKGYQIFNKLQNDTSVDIELIRSGQNKNIHFEMRH
ncbi:MAG: hypothetical protein COB02_03160 [Candidatus Cloacimonadota bacterium]|nr:MAG: hypothetical protein COB02_03160 [Candidatus Cloacimonadota bacterium]